MLSSTVTQINYERRDLDKLVDGVLGTYNLFATETDPNDLDYKLRDCIVCLDSYCIVKILLDKRLGKKIFFRHFLQKSRPKELPTSA